MAITFCTNSSTSCSLGVPIAIVVRMEYFNCLKSWVALVCSSESCDGWSLFINIIMIVAELKRTVEETLSSSFVWFIEEMAASNEAVKVMELIEVRNSLFQSFLWCSIMECISTLSAPASLIVIGLFGTGCRVALNLLLRLFGIDEDENDEDIKVYWQMKNHPSVPQSSMLNWTITANYATRD